MCLQTVDICLDLCPNRQNKEQERLKALMAAQSHRAAALWSVSESVSAMHAMPYITSPCAIWATEETEDRQGRKENELGEIANSLATLQTLPCSCDG